MTFTGSLPSPSTSLPCDAGSGVPAAPSPAAGGCHRAAGSFSGPVGAICRVSHSFLRRLFNDAAEQMFVLSRAPQRAGGFSKASCSVRRLMLGISCHCLAATAVRWQGCSFVPILVQGAGCPPSPGQVTTSPSPSRSSCLELHREVFCTRLISPWLSLSLPPVLTILVWPCPTPLPAHPLWGKFSGKGDGY